jgi:predicted nucleotidyltransferase
MQKSLKNLSEIKNKLKIYLNDREVLDVILFGSVMKGKLNPSDIDVAIVSEKELKEIEGFHISFLTPKDFFVNVPSLVNTLFREGYSLKNDCNFSEVCGFKSSCLFVYHLSGLSASKKVTLVNFLRGNKNMKGLVSENGGEWISQGCFSCSIDLDYLFDQFFITQKVKFRKYYLLIH